MLSKRSEFAVSAKSESAEAVIPSDHYHALYRRPTQCKDYRDNAPKPAIMPS